MYVGSSDSRPPTGGDEVPPQALEGGDALMSDPPPPSQGEVPRLQDQEGAPKSPKLEGEGDPITISDKTGGLAAVERP